MNIKVEQSIRGFYVDESTSMRRYGTFRYAGNYSKVTRVIWIKVFWFWVPCAFCSRIVNIDSVLGFTTLGDAINYDECFSEKFKLDRRS